MTIRTQTRDVPALSMRATLGSVNVEKRTVELVFSTGAKVLRSSWLDGPFWEELSMDPAHVRMGRLNNGAPFLADHNGYSVARTPGVVESARLEGGKGIAVVRFDTAENDPDAEKLFRKIQNGIVQNVSVGYRVFKMEKLEDVSEKIPTFRAVDWEPHEISAVAMGADDAAGFRSAESTQKNPCSFLSHEPESKEMTPEQIAEQKRQEAEAQAARELEITQRAQAAERTRQSGITAAFRSFGKGLSDARAAKLAGMLAGDTTIESARAYVLEDLARASDEIQTEQHTVTERGEEDSEKFRRGLSDALLQRVPAAVKAAERKLQGFEGMGDGGHYRGMRLSDVARLCAARAGHKVDGIYSAERLLDLALQGRNGYATPSDFAVLFEDIARKSMRAGYATQAIDSWKRWMGTDSVSDFRDSSRFMKGSFAGLPVVPSGAEYKNIEIPDGAKLAINTETRGGIIAIGRHAIVNDDLGVLTNMAAEFGGSAAYSIELAAYALLALNSGLGPTITRAGVTAAFFDQAAWGNVSTGAALGTTGAALSLDRAHMRKQTDVSGNRVLDITPRILLIALPLEDAAKSINNDQFEQGTANTYAKSNQARGMFADIVTAPRAPVLTGTKRYLFTDSKDAFKVVFLDGSGEGPTLSSQEGFRRDGVEYKARIDFKAQAYDPKTAVYNAGQ